MKFWRVATVLVLILFVGVYNQVGSQVDGPQKGPYPLEIPFKFGQGFKIPDNNPLTYEGIELGRMLFYDKRLSKDNTIACSTCHPQLLAFTD